MLEKIYEAEQNKRKNKNYRLKNSTFGDAAKLLDVDNNYEIRQFLASVKEDALRKQRSPSVPPKRVFEDVGEEEIKAVAATIPDHKFNYRIKKSKYGLTCSKLNIDNNKQNRKRIFIMLNPQLEENENNATLSSIVRSFFSNTKSKNGSKPQAVSNPDQIEQASSSSEASSGEGSDQELPANQVKDSSRKRYGKGAKGRRYSDRNIYRHRKGSISLPIRVTTNVQSNKTTSTCPEVGVEADIAPASGNVSALGDQLQAMSLQASALESVAVRLASVFAKAVYIFPSCKCECCGKQHYACNTRAYTATSSVSAIYSQLGQELCIGKVMQVCDRCRRNFLAKNKVPSFALANKMSLAPVPAELRQLSAPEIRLISQVNPYLKMFVLCGGRGQKAVKGIVVHFHQDCDEVIQQLPLTLVQADMVIVNEAVEGVERSREFQIRPSRVYAALEWLKVHNPLYRNVDIVPGRTFDNVQDITVNHLSAILDLHQDASDNARGHLPLLHGVHILRATINQSHSTFPADRRGKQCTAMSATFIAYAHVEPPTGWVRDTMDQVVFAGDLYYAEKRPMALGNYLDAGEVEGVVRGCFGGRDVSLQADHLAQLSGYLNRAKIPHYPKLHESLHTLIQNSNTSCAILTTAEFSFGLFKDENSLHFFDSHSRGPKGGVCRDILAGTACLLRYPIEEAASAVSKHVHKNCQPRTLVQTVGEVGAAEHYNNLRLFLYTITPFNVTLIVQADQDADEPASGSEGSDNEPDANVIVVSPTKSPAKKIRRKSVHFDTDSDDDDGEDNDPVPHPQNIDFVQDLNGIKNAGDTVLHREDFADPNIADFVTIGDDGVQRLQLNRRAGRPLNSRFDKDLQLLSFPHLFPDGKNGANTDRVFKITTADYYQHILLSGDPRFFGMSDLIFYALSAVEVERVLQKVSVCCQLRRGDSAGIPDLEIDEVNIAGLNNPHLYLSAIRGSDSYWMRYRGDCIAMIKSLGIPTFFITFSFDDLNSVDCINAMWKANHMYLDVDDVDPSTIPSSERKDLLNTHPIAAARHFNVRLIKFLALIQKEAVSIFGFALKDYTLRVEFQARGSPHAHMLVWLSNVPAWDSQEGMDVIERNISCTSKGRLRELVLKYQSHRHSKTCYKKPGSTCRFHFSRPVTQKTKILPDDNIHKNGGRLIELKRDSEDVNINNYHPILLEMLKCNMDIQPVTSAMAIAYYIAKYISKPESSVLRPDVQNAICAIKDSSISPREKMTKISLTLLRNREVSVQEAVFRLISLPMKRSSRITIFLPTFPKLDRYRLIAKESLNKGEPKFHLNIIEKYENRPLDLESLCLYEFASLYKSDASSNVDFDADLLEEEEEELNDDSRKQPRINLLNNKGRVMLRKQYAVVKCVNYDPIGDKSNYYYSMLLMYLPFREENFCVDKSPMEVFEQRHAELRRHEDNPIINIELSEQLDRALLRVAELDLDNEHDNENEPDFDPFAEQFIDDNPPDEEEVFRDNRELNIVQQVQINFESLSDDKKQIFRKVDDLLRGKREGPIRLICSGEGGVGKSFLIEFLTDYIRKFVSHTSVLIAAPTGVAAFNVVGTTLHRAFSLGVELGKIANYNKLSAVTLQKYRNLYRNRDNPLQFVIIDEFSMVNYQTLRSVSLRLGEIFENDEPFGGLNVLLFGDLMQLKPCCGNWIFDKPTCFKAEVDLWRLFEFNELTYNHRQGSDPLGGICSRLRVGALTSDDIRTLGTRLLDPLLPNYNRMVEQFSDCVWIFHKLADVLRFNLQKSLELDHQLRQNGDKVYRIVAKTFLEGTDKECNPSLIPKKENHCGGLPHSIHLGVGSRVMLRRNIDIGKGLVNGATGVVVGIRWTALRRVQMHDGDLPESVAVKFDHDIPGTPGNTIHIQPTTTRFYGRRSTLLSRHMLPLILAWAINTHKMQGVTKRKIVVNLGKSMFAKGIGYVVLSRCTTLEGVAISDFMASKLLRNNTYSPCCEKALRELERLRATIT